MNQVRSATRPSRRLLATGVAFLALLAVNFWWTGHWLVARWEQANSYYSHGWLIPPICAGLLYLRRRQLAAASVRPSRWGLALLVPAILVHLLGTAWQVGFLSGFALLGVLGGLVLTTLGPEVFRVALFPLAFLAFMVPVPEILIEKVSFNLKLLAAAVSTGFLDTIGFAAVRQGSYIQIPSGSVIVDDVCSGLKYLIALTAFGALYAYISRLGPVLKVVLFSLAIPIAFVANVVRVTLMVLVAYVWGLGVSERWYVHDLFGFALFAVAFVLLFVAESVLLGLTGRASGEGGEEPEQSDPGPPEGTAAPGPGLLALGSASAPMKGLLCVLAASAALSLYLSWPRETTPASEHLAAFPLEVGEWRGVDAPLSEREYRVLGTRNVLSRRYQDSHGNQVQFVAVVAQQMRRRTHPPEQCLTGGGYSITGTEERAVAFSTDGSERAIGVQELLMRRSVQTKVVWYFFKSGDEVHTSYWLHQAGVALRKLRDRGAADVLVRFDTAAPMGEEDGARTVLSEFAREVLPVVMAELP